MDPHQLGGGKPGVQEELGSGGRGQEAEQDSSTHPPSGGPDAAGEEGAEEGRAGLQEGGVPHHLQKKKPSLVTCTENEHVGESI